MGKMVYDNMKEVSLRYAAWLTLVRLAASDHNTVSLDICARGGARHHSASCIQRFADCAQGRGRDLGVHVVKRFDDAELIAAAEKETS